jgi:hypothetical protein
MIKFEDAKIQLAETLEEMYMDFKSIGYVRSLTSYCNGTTEFPYSHLRKMEKMGILLSRSIGNRDKTYEWIIEDPMDCLVLAQNILNNAIIKKEKIILNLDSARENNLTLFSAKLAIYLNSLGISETKIPEITNEIRKLFKKYNQSL